MSNFEKFSKFVIEMIKNGDEKTQEALHSAIDLAINVILNSLSAWASELDDKQLSRENKIHLVSKLTADIDGFIMPLHKMIEGIDLEDERADKYFQFDATVIAREIKAIKDDEHIQIDVIKTEKGQNIQTSVGKKVEINLADCDDDTREKLEQIALATGVVAKA
jgi:predicted metal-dependent peptidase